MSSKLTARVIIAVLVSLMVMPFAAHASWYPYNPTPAPAPAPAPTPAPAPAPTPVPSTQTNMPSWYTNRAYYLQLQQPTTPTVPTAPTTPTVPTTPTTPTVPTTPTTPTVPTTPTTPTWPPTTTTLKVTPATSLTADEQQMFDLVNQERVKAGLKPVQIDMLLVATARMKAQDILDNNYFSHFSPTYGSPTEMLKKAGVSFRFAGENLSKARDTVTSHYRLMASEGHRFNILYKDYTHVGIGIIRYQYGVCVAQHYIGR